MKKLFAVLAALATLSTGCAGPGEVKKLPITMPDGERATIVAHDQKVPDYWLDYDKLALNYIVKGDVTDKQLAAVAEGERVCRIYVKTTNPSKLVAVISDGILYVGAGALGLGLGSRSFPGTDHTAYAKYGAAGTGTVGAAGGVTKLGIPTYSFHNCGKDVMDTFPQYKVRVLAK